MKSSLWFLSICGAAVALVTSAFSWAVRCVDYLLDAIPASAGLAYAGHGVAMSHGAGDDHLAPSLSHSLRHEAGVARRSAARNI